MKRLILLAAATVSVSACGMLGGKKNNSTPSTQPAQSSSSAPRSSTPMPGATQPMNPLDYKGGMAGGSSSPGTAAASTVSATTTASATATPAAATTPTLYTRLGGQEAIRAVVHDFGARIMADDRISAFFRGVEMDKFERLLTEQICLATGGPCTYTGRPMRVAHEGLNINEAQFNALVEDLTASLTRFNVPPRESNELLTALAGMKQDIVGH